MHGLQKTHSTLLNRAKALQDVERKALIKSIKAIEDSMDEMASMIVAEAGKRIPSYDKLVDILGISGDNHLFAREALAETLMYVRRSNSYKRLKKFFGLFKGRRWIDKFYNKPARRALIRLTTALLNNAYHKTKDEEKILRRIWTTVKGEPRERLETPA